MSDKDRYVFDTGVVVSAAMFPDSIPGRAMREGFRKGTLVLSPATAEELADVLSRTRFDRYVSRRTRQRFLATFVYRAQVMDTTQCCRICRDPKDDKFLDIAMSCGAAFLVTGDKDLLTLDSFKGVRVVTPAKFLDLLASGD